MIEHSKSTIGKEELAAVSKVIKSNVLSEGSVVNDFEKELSLYMGARGGVATSTGTAALHLALLCLGVGSGCEVILPSYVCRSVLNAVMFTGARPVLCDVNRDDYNISLDSAKKKISLRTKVIIIAHMFGYPADIEGFLRLGLPIIEDCAHSPGALYKGKPVGSFGELSVFSFEGTKYMVTGEGGMLLANSPALLKKTRKIKNSDSNDREAKYTYRMTNLQAAIGLTQLKKLDLFKKKRIEIAQRFTRVFSGLDIILPQKKNNRDHIFHRYMIQINNNIDKFMRLCFLDGVKVKQPVKPYPLHKYLGLSNKYFPNTHIIMNSAVSIPIYPGLKERDLIKIERVVKKNLR